MTIFIACIPEKTSRGRESTHTLYLKVELKILFTQVKVKSMHSKNYSIVRTE